MVKLIEYFQAATYSSGLKLSRGLLRIEKTRKVCVKINHGTINGYKNTDPSYLKLSKSVRPGMYIMLEW